MCDKISAYLLRVPGNTGVYAIALFLSTTALCAQTLHVEIKNVKNAKGYVRVGLFRQTDEFLKTPWQGRVVPATTPAVQAEFQNVPPGTYAISIIHDENGDEELNTNLLGMPKEGFGFSNDAMNTFGPPDFKKASFTMQGATTRVALSVRYF
jgi:uncharacterized protein (DUF2141 family)